MSIPTGSPLFYYHLAQASYADRPHDYLDKAFGKGRVTKHFGDANALVPIIDGPITVKTCWRARFFRDNFSGETVVAFRGSDTCGNWLYNIKQKLDLFDRIAKCACAELDRLIQGFVEAGKRAGFGDSIWTFVGHSQAGYFATHVKKSWDVFRITFNGHKCPRGDKVINLRIHGDPVSSTFGSVRDRYISLPSSTECPKIRHSLNQFAYAFANEKVDEEWVKHPKPIDSKSWDEVDSSRFPRSRL